MRTLVVIRSQMDCRCSDRFRKLELDPMNTNTGSSLRSVFT